MNTLHDMSEYDIEALALEYGFEQLSEEQQLLVLAALGTRSAYERLRRAQRLARQSLFREAEALEPRPETREDIHAALRRRHVASRRERFSLRRLLTYRIPAYMAIPGATAVVAIGLLFNWPHSRMQPVVRDTVIYVTVADSDDIQRERDEMVQRVIDSLKGELQRQFAIQSPRSLSPERRIARVRQHSDPHEAIDHTRTASLPVNHLVGLETLPPPSTQERRGNSFEDSAGSRFRSGAARDSF
jgi:hypothetical protein